MKRQFWAAAFAALFAPALLHAADSPTSPTLALHPGEARVLKAEGYERLTKAHGKDLLVINFWATWCAPCVAELPYFAAAHEQFKPRGVQFAGISMDFLDDREPRVEPFLKEHKIPYPNYVLDVNQNEFLTKYFPEEWTGAIPATFLYDREGRLVAHHLEALEKEELEALILKALEKAR